MLPNRAVFAPLVSILLAAGFAFAIVSCQGSTKTPPPPSSLVGAWVGSAHIVNDWVTTADLDVSFEIAADGSVEGRVGDATLVGGRIRPSRGDLGRWLGVKTDWIVEADLEGALIAAEGIERDRVQVPLNLVDGSLTGGLHSGSRKLGTRSRVVSAADLELVHPADESSESDSGD